MPDFHHYSRKRPPLQIDYFSFEPGHAATRSTSCNARSVLACRHALPVERADQARRTTLFRKLAVMEQVDECAQPQNVR
jgi:hypothetical protein